MKRLERTRDDDARDFRRTLASELAARCTRNPRYSLRAFASFLGIDHSTLSQILRKRRTLSEATIRQLATKLGHEDAALSQFLAFERRSSAAAGDPRIAQLAADAVEVLADWYHFAILELTHLSSFRADSRWVARVLDLSVDEVNIALQRLVRLRLLRMDGGRWHDLSGVAVGALEDFDDAAVGRLTAQLRQIALERLRDDDESLQHQSFTTMAVDSNRLPEALARLSRTPDDLRSLFDPSTARDAVYQLEIRFYPLTHTEEESNVESRDPISDPVEES